MAFSALTTAHGQFNRICQVVSLWTASNTCFLGPTQVHIPNGIMIGSAVLHSAWQKFPILYNENCHCALGIWTTMYYMVLWAHLSPLPKQHLDRLSHFCRAHDCDRQTD